MKNIKYSLKLSVIAILIGVWSCSEDFLVEVPSNSQSPQSITLIADAQIVLNGAYDLMQNNYSYGSSIITRMDVRSDDMQSADYGRLANEYLYDYATDNATSGLWTQPYRIIRHVCNILNFIGDIEAKNDIDEENKKNIEGQALTIRALQHFDLCKTYGLPYSHNGGTSLGVPVVNRVLDPDEKLKRNTVAEVYDQIIADLTAAIPLLSQDKDDGYINSWAAKTLLARTYLYKEDNANAYATAVDIIENGPYSLVVRDKYVDSWSKDFTTESIFSIVNSVEDNSGLESVAALSDPEGYGQFIASQDLIDLILSDTNDIRKEMLYYNEGTNGGSESTDNDSTWGRVLKYPGKGNTKAIIVAHHESWRNELKSYSYTSNNPVFRLSEVYLIAAEAAIKNSDKANAAKYLNPIVERANPAATVAEANVDLDRILLERRKELMAEGHRLFNQIRNKRDIVRKSCPRVFDITTRLHIPYDDYQVVFPIPRSELDVNPVIQNPGYQD